MDYFNDVLTTFLGLERGIQLLSMQGPKALGFIKNILICVTKMKVLWVWRNMRVSN